MTRTLISTLPKAIGEIREIRGWVKDIRKLGKMMFLTVHDFTGTVQVFVGSKFVDKVSELKPESVITLTAKVNERPPKQVKKEEGPLGAIELEYQSHVLLSSAETPPFEINKDTRQVSDELRLEYRYIDLRNPRMTKNLRMRDAIFTDLRAFLHAQQFTEIETPYLTKGTPEGAREYIVPARNFPGTFYVLPQSPQQFKQLLMVAGIERYFQIVRCFRDEDQRKDRQPEFTQVDIEMSFASKDEILALVEQMMIRVVEKLYPEKHITQIPFPRIKYHDAMKKYGSDKPDIRKDKKDPHELGFCFVVDFPLFEYSDSDKKLVSVHHLFTSPHPDDVALLDSTPQNARALQYDLALNGFEVAGGSIRIYDPQLQKKIFDILQIPEEEAQTRFGHMLKAFSFGVPPHGGIAIGADRFVAIMQNEDQIREVIAFPKTGDARDPLMGSPTVLSADRISEANIQLKKKK